jgi:hypothetical protein
LEFVRAAAIGAVIFPDALAAVDGWIAVTTVVVSFLLALRGVRVTGVRGGAVLRSWAAIALL